jgi:gas vesicle structural protein
MAVERHSGGTSLIDVLDRVLDKGIVIDAWVRISLVGIDLITVEARVVVASIDTYLKYAEAVGITAPVARPVLESPRVDLQMPVVERTSHVVADGGKPIIANEN